MNVTEQSDLLNEMRTEGTNIVVIAGPPACGKTTCGNALSKIFPEYKLIKSDDYMEHGFLQSLYVMMNDIKTALEAGQKLIIEGIMSARLLRKGLELNSFKPDFIVMFDIPFADLVEQYQAREGKEKAYPVPTLKAFNTVWKQYMEMALNTNEPLPRILMITNA